LLLNFVPALTFIFSLTSIITTSVRHSIIAKSTCYWENGYYDGTTFECTRELGVCRIVGYTWDEKGLFGDVTDTYVQLHRARTMLIPLAALSAFVLGVGVARMMIGKKGEDETKTADERVERLQRE
jgi:hypothetical protein